MKDRPPVLAHQRFEQSKAEFDGLALDQVFAKIHATNLWGSPDSASGLGSELQSTARLREQLPELLRELEIKTLLDIPCGDFHWLSQVALPVERYIGADIVEGVVQANCKEYGREFEKLDLCTDPLPKADLVLCRDCLVHLSNANIQRAVANLKASQSQWLLTTHFFDCPANVDIDNGDWRMLNFELPPFLWPPPQRVLVEGCAESGGGYGDKVLALWPVAAL